MQYIFCSKYLYFFTAFLLKKTQTKTVVSPTIVHEAGEPTYSGEL